MTTPWPPLMCDRLPGQVLPLLDAVVASTTGLEKLSDAAGHHPEATAGSLLPGQVLCVTISDACQRSSPHGCRRASVKPDGSGNVPSQAPRHRPEAVAAVRARTPAWYAVSPTRPALLISAHWFGVNDRVDRGRRRSGQYVPVHGADAGRTRSPRCGPALPPLLPSCWETTALTASAALGVVQQPVVARGQETDVDAVAAAGVRRGAAPGAASRGTPTEQRQRPSRRHRDLRPQRRTLDRVHARAFGLYFMGNLSFVYLGTPPGCPR